MTVLLAVVAGGALGLALERGDFCFHSVWRGVFVRPAKTDGVRAYVLLLILSIPFVQLLRSIGWIDPWIAPLVWRANLAGGLAFGIGMAIARTCVTGMFYKFGQGMLGAVVAIVGWVIGDVVTYRGPLSSIRESLNTSPLIVDGETATLSTIGGPVGPLIVAMALAAGIVWLTRHRAEPSARRRRYDPSRPTRAGATLWGWAPLGLALALIMSASWLLADIDGQDYSFGTSGVPTTFFDYARRGGTGTSWWIPLALLSISPAALLAARRSGTTWLRGESGPRYAQLASGGFVMGVGAAIAGGCNLGHAMVGVPLLSIGSMLSTAAMIAGVAIGTQLNRIVASQTLFEG